MNTYWIILITVIINNAIIALCVFIYRQIGKKRGLSDAAEAEIISIVNESAAGGYIEDNEAEMINNIFEFGDKQAKDIMTDRSNIIAIDGSMRLNDALTYMLESGHSRFPVYEEDQDRIIGILHLKDAMKYSKIKGNNLKPVDGIDGLLREARFIPMTRKIDSLFHTMQGINLQMVIVIDEYGQTAGLIAMKDILEEIVGNLSDEYDEDDDRIVERGEDKYIIDGITELEVLSKRFGIDFGTEDFETINGYMISRMGKIPDKKERFDITIGDYNFKILEVDHNMIRQILVTKVLNNPDTEPEDNTKDKTDE